MNPPMSIIGFTGGRVGTLLDLVEQGLTPGRRAVLITVGAGEEPAPGADLEELVRRGQVLKTRTGAKTWGYKLTFQGQRLLRRVAR